ncbi:MAG: cysteine desulfurase family protein [Myxococcota bacterium]
MTPSSPLYLDHNATTPPAPEVVAAMRRALEEAWGNPSSAHPAGRAARRAVEQATEQVAALIGAHPDEIVFTSGGTESNDLAIFGTLAVAPADRRGILTTAVEHPAVALPVAALEAQGHPVVRLAPDTEGALLLGSPPGRGGLPPLALATVMLANNETGAIHPVAALAERARAAGAVVHTDAAQAVGKIPVDVDALGVDLLTVVGHKLYGPKGVGALYVRRGTALRPRLLGGGQQRGLRPGTEAVPSIVGLGAACERAGADLQAEGARQASLRDELAGRLREAVPGLVVTAERAPRLPNTLHVRFPGVTGATILARCGSVAASTGSACHDGIEQPSQVLLAMGIAPGDALGAVRLSLGRSTTASEVVAAAAALAAAWSGDDGRKG